MRPSSPLQNCKIQHKSSFSSSSSSLSASSCLDQRSPVQMDIAGWPHQKIGLVKPVEDMPPASFSTTTNSASNNCTAAVSRSQVTERRVRPQKDQQALNCPRCNSTNTKFCYYNNYSLTQPRYFCKACRRYWTAGGSLRNVPVGGGSRKNKRSSLVPSSSGTAATASIKKPTTTISPKIYDQGQHLNQAFQHSGLPGINDFAISINGAIDSSNACPPVGAFSAMELLRNGMISTSRSFGPLVSMPMPYTSAFGLQELRPPVTLSFPLDGVHGEKKHGSVQGLQESGDGRMLFPFNESAPPVVPSSASGDHFAQGSRGGGGEPPGFWINGMIEY